MAGLGGVGAVLLAAGALCLGSGCSDLGYYRQSVGGHLDLMSRAKPVDDWIAQGDTPAALKQRLALSKQMRDFSVQVLKLPDNPSYRAYADLQRPAAVWNVVAAPALSLQLKTWCYPVTGCVGYRGYFDRAQADALGASLRAEGWDVSVYGVPAYSTLGWSNWIGGDPLLNTFVNGSEAELARLIFHELAHQKLYVADDTMFNESFATAVERIGTRLWLEQHGSQALRAQYLEGQQRRQDFRELTRRYRDKLEQSVRQCPQRRGQARRQGRAAGATARRLRADEAAALGRLCRLRRVVFSGQQCLARRAGGLQRTGRRFRAAVRAAGQRFRTLLCPCGADRCLAEGPAPRHTTRHSIEQGGDLVADIRIHREHQLGLSKARKVAGQWAEDVEKNFGMQCSVIEGDFSDTIEFTRTGVKGTLIVAADHFDLNAKLGFLLGAFSRTIETEIERNLDKLLNAGAAAPAKKAAAARKPRK
jgi:putative polyhydroxyalkanoate system protein